MVVVSALVLAAKGVFPDRDHLCRMVCQAGGRATRPWGNRRHGWVPAPSGSRRRGTLARSSRPPLARSPMIRSLRIRHRRWARFLLVGGLLALGLALVVRP